jgi:hypothetical protein
VADLARLRFAMFQLAAEPRTIDAVEPGPAWTPLRVASDEVLWLGPHGASPGLRVVRLIAELEPKACLCDVADGWAGILVRGAGRHELLSSLSPLSIDVELNGPSFLQGDVLGVPGKILAHANSVAVLFPATASWYVGVRLADLGEPLDDAPATDWHLLAPSSVDAAVDPRTAV